MIIEGVSQPFNQWWQWEESGVLPGVRIKRGEGVMESDKTGETFWAVTGHFVGHKKSKRYIVKK